MGMRGKVAKGLGTTFRTAESMLEATLRLRGGTPFVGRDADRPRRRNRRKQR
jgi:hypothetical protein